MKEISAGIIRRIKLKTEINKTTNSILDFTFFWKIIPVKKNTKKNKLIKLPNDRKLYAAKEIPLNMNLL